MNVPQSLVIGDTWSWTEELADYPADTWTLTYYFANNGGSFSVLATAAGTDYAVSVAAATTAQRVVGRYYWQARVTDGASVLTVGTGWVDVLPNPSSTGKQDHRSWARRTLDAIEAFLEGNATTAQASMTIGGRSLTRWSLPDLMQWRDRLRQEVRTEEQGELAGLGRDIKVRF